MSAISLSPDHPLRLDPKRPWPYKVLVGYRARGNRKIIAHRSVYVRATSELQAQAAAMREARAMMPMVKDGVRLKASRTVSVRPLDKSDCIGDDALSATRRAITRAAAAIGEQMQNEQSREA